MSTPESQLLRDGIRNGQIRCRRPAEGGQCNPHIGDHERGCPWNAAVIRIYEIERAAEPIAHTEPVDWGGLLMQLRKRGLSVRSVAEQVGCSHSVLVEYGQGIHRPLHSYGEKLIAFWCQVTGNDRALLPRAAGPASAASIR